MKKLFLLLLLFPFLLGCSQKEKEFTVLQWNIWQEGTVIPGGYDAIVNEIARLRPDFVTLSEVRNYENTNFTARLVQSLKEKGETYYSFYLALAKGYELETGLKFLSASTFKIFTPVAGLSKEVGNNLITLRNFFTFAEKNRYYGNSFSWKYFLNDDRDHFSLMAGLGNAPDSKNFDFSEQFISNKLQYIGLGFEKNWKPVKFSTAVVYNRNHFSTGSQFDQFDIYLNLFYNFK